MIKTTTTTTDAPSEELLEPSSEGPLELSSEGPSEPTSEGPSEPTSEGPSEPSSEGQSEPNYEQEEEAPVFSTTSLPGVRPLVAPPARVPLLATRRNFVEVIDIPDIVVTRRK